MHGGSGLGAARGPLRWESAQCQPRQRRCSWPHSLPWPARPPSRDAVHCIAPRIRNWVACSGIFALSLALAHGPVRARLALVPDPPLPSHGGGAGDLRAASHDLQFQKYGGPRRDCMRMLFRARSIGGPRKRVVPDPIAGQGPVPPHPPHPSIHRGCPAARPARAASGNSRQPGQRDFRCTMQFQNCINYTCTV